MNHRILSGYRLLAVALLAAAMGGCTAKTVQPGTPLKRYGDEIVVAGRYFRTGAPVVLWTDPGGYDAYRTERRFVPWDRASYAATTQEARDIDSPNRYNVRERVLSAEELNVVRGGGWPLELLQEKVDQFVIHYDVCGTARQCFNILHDHRGLSVQFMLDVDGTIYQTLDLKERAWHATIANSRSVGVEIANIGAYIEKDKAILDQWYRKDDQGTRMVLPVWMKQEWIRTPGFIARPARQEMIAGEVQGETRYMYDLTPEQYDSLTKLVATLSSVLPKIQCDYPRDENGRLINHVLTREQFDAFQGVIGHYHIQSNKQDPGPAFDWDRVINGARKMMSRDAIARMEAARGKPVREVQRPRPATQPTS